MGKRLTTEEFINKAKLVHGDKYDYSLVNYITSKMSVKIICPIHGEFEQKPNYHLSKCGCNKCGIETINIKLKINTQELINKFNLIHNFKYDYSLIKFNNLHDKIKIICPEHGEFNQIAHNHLIGKGCSICTGMDRNLTTNKIIKTFNKKHKNKYDYSLVNFITTNTKVKILCSIHGVFDQTPAAHSKGQGCPICNESKGEKEIKELLNSKNIRFLPQHRFPDCRYKRQLPFDFYLPEYNICIEFNGLQHYKPIDYFGGEKTFKILTKRDKIKMEYCLNNNIPLMIIKYNDNISLKLSDISVIRENII